MTTRRPRRHWKHSRFEPTDSFVWSKPCTWEGAVKLPGDLVDKDLVGEKKLRRLHRARFIEAEWTHPVIKDPLAPAAAGTSNEPVAAEPVVTSASSKKRRTRKVELEHAAA